MASERLLQLEKYLWADAFETVAQAKNSATCKIRLDEQNNNIKIPPPPLSVPLPPLLE